MRRTASLAVWFLLLSCGVVAGGGEEPPVRQDRPPDDCSLGLILPMPEDLKGMLRDAVNKRPQPDSLETYCEVMRDTISLNWNPWEAPAMQTGEIANMFVTFTIGRSGELGDLISVEASTFDEVVTGSAIQAIQVSAPFPPVPPGFTGERVRVSIRFASAEWPARLPPLGGDRLRPLP